MSQALSVIDIVEGTSVDGPGLRTSIYFAGCTHHCIGCHNPQSWDVENGRQYSIDTLMEIVGYNDFPVTLTGGDPLFQIDEVTELARNIKEELGLNIWCYTGYLWENIVRHAEYVALLHYIDVLVDGQFMIDKRDTSLRFRGSSNQRIIDVQASLQAKKVIIAEF